MKTIWKFPLVPNTGNQAVPVPLGSRILCVQTQNGMPHLWAEVTLTDDSDGHEMWSIWTFGTGHNMPPNMELRYVGTYQLLDGALVYHVYVEIPSVT